MAKGPFQISQPGEPGLEDNLLETEGRGRDGEAERSAEGHSTGSGLQLRKCSLQTLMFPNMGEAVVEGLLV